MIRSTATVVALAILIGSVCPIHAAETKNESGPKLSGDNLIIGQSNAPTSPNNTTSLYNPSSTDLSPRLFRVANYSTTDATSYISNFRIGLIAGASGVDMSGGTGRAGLVGVTDVGPSAYGVWGMGFSSATGVLAQSETGTGLSAVSGGNAIEAVGGVAGYGARLEGGKAPLYLTPNFAFGPPAAGVHQSGELVVDASSSLWYCTASGTPGTWRQVVAPTSVVMPPALSPAPPAQTSAFLYQGVLRDASGPVSGFHNLTFTLYDGAGTALGTMTQPHTLTDGLLMAALDFGSTAFGTGNRFLEIAVDAAPLSPRQLLSPAPLALALPGVRTSENGSSVAAGLGAVVGGGHQGAFVWADSRVGSFASARADQFRVRATGGVEFVTAVDGSGVPINGVSLGTNGGGWSYFSDRAVKRDFAAVDGRDVLARVEAMPVGTWVYTSETDEVRHMGPTAQDFHAAFGLNGDDDRKINGIDTAGVSLAAIQGLAARLREQDKTIDALLQRLAALEARLGEDGTAATSAP